MVLVVNHDVRAGGIRETLNRNVLPGLGHGSRMRRRSRGMNHRAKGGGGGKVILGE